MRRAAAVLAVAVTAAAAPAARADTFGSPGIDQPFGTTDGCASLPCSIADRVHSDGSAETGAPFDGVLTRVRIRYAGDGADATFRVLRSAGAGSFQNVGPEMPETLPDTGGAERVLSFDERRPIQAGDRLALAADSSFAGDAYAAGGAPRGCWSRSGSHPVGSTATYSAACGFEVLLEGTVEPDADGDGYGDVSQDGCPSDPSIHASDCSADLALAETAGPATVMVGQPATFTFTISNRGASPAQNVGMTVPTGPTTELVSAAPSSGLCGGIRAVFCWLGTIQPGATATLTVVVAPDDPGTLSLASSTTSLTPDPNSTNDYAEASVTVIDPFPGVRIPPQRVRVRGSTARIVHGCPADTPHFCTGSVRLTAGGRGAGSGSFRLQPGASAAVAVHLSKSAAARLHRRGRLAVLVTTTAQDAAKTKRTTKAQLTLRGSRTKHRH